MLFNKVAGHFKNFFLKLKIGKKDEILSKYHLVARHFKIVSTFYNIRYFKGEYFCLCLCQNLEFASAPPLISNGPGKGTSVQMHKRCGNCFTLYNLFYEKLWF